VKALLLNPPAAGGVRYVREGRCEQRLSSFQYNMIPISMPSTAGLLRREGHEVLMVDAVAERLSVEDVIRIARDFDARLLLVNVSTPTFRSDAAAAGRLRDEVPGIFAAAYGVHVTALPEESLAETTLDAVIRGEPEVTATDLARALSEGLPLAEVKGISFRSQAEGPGAPAAITHNPDRPFLEDLDSIPPPALDLVDHSLYPAPVSGEPHTLIITSRGCPYPCTFCSAHIYYGTRLRLRDPKLIVAEIREIHERDGVNLFTFWSDTFTLKRDHVEEICREIIDRGLKIRWMCNSRVDRVDPELLSTMAAAGCRVISYGVESGEQAILDNIRKGTKVRQIVDAFRWTRESGIQSAAHVILGLPGETAETLRTTIRLVAQIRPDYVQYYGAIPFPGTAFLEQARREGWLATTDWEDYEIGNNVVSTPALSAEELGRWRRRAYLSFYLRPSYMLERLGDVRSPRDLLQLCRAGVSFLRDWALTGKGD
jgi:radical SAM superfamily enzyme YgiQ (UPF0313 family)